MTPFTPGSQLGDYLRARRQRTTPEQVGLVAKPGRRVPGLRREEVAELAGVSPDYYLRLEQGKDRRPSDQVIAGLARALRLDDDARRYLVRLAAPRPFLRPATESHPLSASVTALLDQWATLPAYATDANQNVLAATSLARALAPGLLRPGVNLLVSAFEQAAHVTTESPDAEEGAEWESTLREMTAAFRYHGDLDDPGFHQIVGALTNRYPLFRTLWAEHDARPQLSGVRPAHVDTFGWVDFRWQTLDVPGPAPHFITILFPTAGSRGIEALDHLARRSGDEDDSASLLSA
ncbi:helix-turn-helix transcriptional regulator [Herbiconiux moechotypicola]|uniref:Helix-turn-helix transcriptional regulator n=1 Tax=Herbiconiux moechotypicola TaxID=637393 RepID=A0ABN3E282_9MICO|nr:helix-turn-helix transcriptional regulator [Herbiconiux moechotypicola]MCS5731374.1 helix-turn-helix transcriptional regulator [Herbiconiux moechotypicola]